MPGLANKYRPGTWDEVVGQDKVVQRLRTLVRKISELTGDKARVRRVDLARSDGEVVHD